MVGWLQFHEACIMFYENLSTASSGAHGEHISIDKDDAVSLHSFESKII